MRVRTDEVPEPGRGTGRTSTQEARDRRLMRSPSTWTQQLSTVETVVLLAGIALLAGLAVSTTFPGGRQRLGLTSDASAALLTAAAVYSLGHLVRGLRLAILLKDPVVGVRRVMAAHLLTSGLSLLLPFRLGDLIRMRVTGVLVGSTTRGVVAIVLERLLDVGVVLGISIVAAATVSGTVYLLTPLLVLTGLFVVATIAAVTVVPDYLQALSLYLVRRPTVPGGTRLVASMERVMIVLKEAPRLMQRRTPTLVVLTALIWLAEFVALRLAMPVLADNVIRLTGVLASFLSSLSSGAVALLPGSLDRALTRPPLLSSLDNSQVETYRTVLVVPLLWASAVAGVLIRPVLTGSRRLRRRPGW